MNDRPLKGIRAIEIGTFVAAPKVGRFLAALGAEVIKVETNRKVDPVTFAIPETLGAAMPCWHAAKRRISLDVRNPEGRDIFERLIAVSDIFITNLMRKTLARWGIDFPRLREIKPDIIIAWVTAMGGEGPYGDYSAYGTNIGPLCGITSLSGMHGQAPLMIAGGYSDHHTAVWETVGILNALLRRRQTGEGAIIEDSVFTSGAATIGPAVLDYQANGRLPERMGNKESFAHPHGTYRCKGEDRWCAIAVFDDRQWDSFCRAVGNPVWTKDAKYSTYRGRTENADELDSLISQWTMSRSAEEVAEIMQRAGVPSAVAFLGEDQVKDAHLKKRAFFRETTYLRADLQKPEKDWEEEGPVITPCDPPISFSETPCLLDHLHRLGEDNEYVYGQVLNMSPREIADLSDSGVFF